MQNAQSLMPVMMAFGVQPVALGVTVQECDPEFRFARRGKLPRIAAMKKEP